MQLFEPVTEARPIDVLFNEHWPTFWFLWPHKVDKQEAMREYRKALKTTDPSEIIRGLEVYVRAKPDWQAWMGPAKFLRRRRWEDVYEVPGNPRVDPELAWQHKAMRAKTEWGRHSVPRQDIEECHRRGLLTDEEFEEAMR